MIVKRIYLCSVPADFWVKCSSLVFYFSDPRLTSWSS